MKGSIFMFPERLKELRNEAGLTQKEIATQLNISQPTYVQWELGRRNPSGETLEKFAKFFKVSTDYLLGNSDIKEPQSKSSNAEFYFRKTVSDMKLTEAQKEQFQKDIISFIEQRKKVFEEEQ
ncbi:helix-turn-helix domain-containing protein [Streptococcus suis]|uniref:helix-turn-helix domain-containing protein n=2 Tax=Streptococcus suis TaxID=1307 RepID=UPI0039B7577C